MPVAEAVDVGLALRSDAFRVHTVSAAAESITPAVTWRLRAVT